MDVGTQIYRTVVIVDCSKCSNGNIVSLQRTKYNSNFVCCQFLCFNTWLREVEEVDGGSGDGEEVIELFAVYSKAVACNGSTVAEHRAIIKHKEGV